MKKLLTGLFLFLVIMPVHAQSKGHLYLEKEYQNVWCKANGGALEVVLYDKARVDCVTPDYAIEFDFAKKWGEAIGQSLYYGTVLNKQSGIVLIMEDGYKDKKYLDRVSMVAKKHNIKVWTITPDFISKSY